MQHAEASNTVKKLATRTVSAQAADELRRRILEGALPAGSLLRQDALAESLGISRIPVREALLQLESEGLVTIVPRRGAVVTEVSPSDIEELFELRVMLEPRLLLRSAPHLTERDYAEIKRILDEYSRDLEDNNISSWGTLNIQLHELLYRHADRPQTITIVRQLLWNTDRLTRLQLTLKGARTHAEEEHALLVELCHRKHFQEAADLLRRHIEHAGASLIEFLRAQPAN